MRDIEIIAVNDGSTDNSLAILEKYAAKDSRIKILNQENRGAGGARNSALNIAAGEFICITDSDDYRKSDCLEKLYNAAIKYNTDAAYGDFVEVDIEGNHIRDFTDSREYDSVLSTDTLFEKSCYQWMFIYKRELIKDIRTVEKTDYEDCPYVYQILMHINTMVHVKDAIYYYRVVPNSSCRGLTQKVFQFPRVVKFMQSVVEKYKGHRLHPILEKKSKIFYADMFKRAFQRMPEDSDFTKIVKMYFEFFKFMNLKQKIYYGYKVLNLNTLFKIKQKKYYKYFVFFNKFKIRVMKKNGKKLKKYLKEIKSPKELK